MCWHPESQIGGCSYPGNTTQHTNVSQTATHTQGIELNGFHGILDSVVTAAVC